MFYLIVLNYHISRHRYEHFQMDMYNAQMEILGNNFMSVWNNNPSIGFKYHSVTLQTHRSIS